MQRAPTTIPEPDPRERALARTLGLPDLLARVLLARGLDDPDRARAHLRPQLNTLADPFLFRDMGRAVERIQHAVRAGEPILVHGDYDVDGISSTVLLLKFFSTMQADVKPYIPNRRDGYSFTEASLQAIREGGYKLCISVDNGTNACEYIQKIQDADCDVIVTDHHGTTENVAPAFAVLNPRLPGAGYPDRDLAGVGVAFKLAAATAQAFSQDKVLSEEFRDFLVDAMAYVALGTVADVAPMRGENRIMVHHGLHALAASRNPGIRALLDSAGLTTRSPETEDISFRIAPLINAAGRMGQSLQAVQLLMSRDYQEAQQAAKVLEVHNEERRRVERALQDKVLEVARSMDDRILVLAGADWHPGVLGIVASRMTEMLHKPTILISAGGESGRGSGRSHAGFHLRDALSACSDCLLAYGGHAAAVGLEIELSRLDEFRAAINEVAALHNPVPPSPQLDGSAGLEELDPHTVRKLDLLGPFGPGNRRPTFVSNSVRLIGNPTLTNRGMDLRFRVVAPGSGGVVLAARIPGGADQFDEIRSRKEPTTLVYSPRLTSRGEEGPVELVVYGMGNMDKPNERS